LAIVGLVAGIILLITVPAIGEILRDILATVLGNTLSSIVEAVASIIGIGTFLYLLVRWIWLERESVTQAGPPPVVTDPEGRTAQPDDQIRKVIANTNEVAQRVSDFAAEFERRSPFRLQPDEAMSMDFNSSYFNSPEYQAEQQQKSLEYNALMDELKERYRQELRSDVVRIRGALADQGITDAQLDELYQSPNNAKKVDALANRLWDMAGRLERRT
jgi:hypothetical protein